MNAPNADLAAAPNHTLASLRAALGPATLDEALALVDGHDKPSLVKEGWSVATPRISTDCARLYGQAYDFMSRASDDQLDLLPAFGREWLRIAVGCAAQADDLYRQYGAQQTGAATQQSSAVAEAGSQHAAAEAKRDQLHAALTALAAGSPSLLAQASSAYGTAKDLAGSIAAQVDLARSWLAAPPGNMSSRLKLTRLTPAWLDKAAFVGTGFGQASTQAGATRSQGAISAADVDHLDGINLVLVRSLTAQFEAAHAADPAVPHLTFNALRSHVHRSHHAAPADKTPAKPAPAST